MSFLKLLTQQATITPRTRAEEPDAHGNRGWEDGDPQTYPALLQQLSAEEQMQDRTEQAADWRLFLPPAAVVDGDSKVVVDGKPYEVVGPPDRLRTPRGEHHVEARLRSVDN